MELTEHGGFLEPWSFSSTTFGGGWCFDENPEMFLASNSSFLGLISSQTDPSPFPEPYPYFLDSFTQIDDDPPLHFQQQLTYPSMELEDPSAEFSGFLHHQELNNNGCCKVEMEQSSGGGEAKKMNSKAKKVNGQPSKNLMAERRRRKRLNDRLSMLRSIVPKISKMDRTSILVDTIAYMKELLERISKLQEEEESEVSTNQMSQNKNQMLMAKMTQFGVERRGAETRIDISCPTRPGLLVSTVSTLEALGIEIQQCVISCFTDFSMHASCSEGDEQRTMINCEDIKQALFRNAGYGGRCL